MATADMKGVELEALRPMRRSNAALKYAVCGLAVMTVAVIALFGTVISREI